MSAADDRIAIVGAGAFGTALAIVGASDGSPVTLWTRDEAHAADVGRARENAARLPGCRLPDGVAVTADPAGLAEADLVLMVVPAQASREVARLFAPLLRPDARIVACAKGIEQATGAFQNEVLASELPGRAVAALSGPGFAAEIASGRPTAVTLAAADRDTADRLCRRLARPAFRPYSATDIRGVELGGAMKNVIAIACGAVIGRGLGESARAALLTRGLAEMARLAEALGARRETLFGLSGLGDLVLTAMSERSRNTRFGMDLAAAGAATAVPAAGAPLAEGVFTAPVAARLGKEHGVALPVTAAVADILAGRLGLDEAIDALVRRPLTSE
jgi:glycerol-3-phosphate dehydrogenase (NAD(P)+)